MLENLKLILRIITNDFDDEINDLILSCQADLVLHGIKSELVADLEDALIQRCVTLYVKANFGWDNKDMEGLNKSYEMLRNHLTFSADYVADVVS
jgi:uncharacterized phage protein (predicted DNA packaging)